MIPVVGAALAYVPIAIILFANGQTGQGIAILVLGFGVIGSIDNVLRFTLLKKLGDVHPLTTVFGVIVGFARGHGKPRCKRCARACYGRAMKVTIRYCNA